MHFHGEGARDRRVRFGPKTARAVSRNLRARDKHDGAALPNLWLAARGTAPLTPNLTGPRAEAAARALLVATLSAGSPAALLGTESAYAAAIPRLTTTATPSEALTHLEERTPC